MNQENDRDAMRDEYDIRGGVRGKYYTRYRAGQNFSVAPNPFVATVITGGVPSDVQAISRTFVAAPTPSPKVEIGSR